VKYTIDLLKEALMELSVFRFTYLGNPDTLIHDLINNPEKLTNAISELMEKFRILHGSAYC